MGFGPAGSPPDASASDIPATFQSFWKKFRSTALKAPKRISRLARLPVHIHGRLDGDPQKRCDTIHLQRVWPVVLTQPILLSSEDGVLMKLTVREFLEQHAVLSPNMVQDAGDNRLRVGDFEFIRSYRKWRLALIYMDVNAIACPAADGSSTLLIRQSFAGGIWP